jgi:hypothetical protein
VACISEEIPETNRKWGTHFRMQLFECMRQHIPIEKYELVPLKAINVEYKYFLPMEQDYYNSPLNNCIWLTLGIGNSTKAEKEFLRMNPQCKMFGVEIMSNNVDDFATFGKVINTGVGGCLMEPFLCLQ